MPVLTGPAIVSLVERSRTKSPEIEFLPFLDIIPFDPARAGPNSYDVCLGNELRVYGTQEEYDHWAESERLYTMPPGMTHHTPVLDVREEMPTAKFTIPESGYILRPGVLYLGSTIEKTKCAGLVPWLDGRSSVGRLGLSIHVTAGRGDDGFGMDTSGGCSWTLEMSVVHPVRIYPGMRIGQLTFMLVMGTRKPYHGRYAYQHGPTPSRLWEDGGV